MTILWIFEMQSLLRVWFIGNLDAALWWSLIIEHEKWISVCWIVVILIKDPTFMLRPACELGQRVMYISTSTIAAPVSVLNLSVCYSFRLWTLATKTSGISLDWHHLLQGGFCHWVHCNSSNSFLLFNQIQFFQYSYYDLCSGGAEEAQRNTLHWSVFSFYLYFHSWLSCAYCLWFSM